MVIRDTFSRGVYAGFVGSLPVLAVDLIAVQLGLSRFYGFQLVSSIYLSPGLTDWAAGVLLGLVLWFGVGAFLGLATSYLLASSGRDNWALKGISLSMIIVYVLMYGFFFNMRGAGIVPFDLATNLTQLVENVLSGISIAYLVARWSPTPLPE